MSNPASFLYSIIEDPLIKQPMHMNFPPAINENQVFRLSIASQSSEASTSSQRLSMASSSTENNNKETYCPQISLKYSTSGKFRNRVLSRFYPSSSSTHRHQKALSDTSISTTGLPSLTSLDLPMESITNHIDPQCMSVKVAEETCIASDWLQKYEQQLPLFALSRSWKSRLFILVGRVVYKFKSSKPDALAQEHFVLTDDTFVFVTEQFKKGYIIELRKPHCNWFIRCESIKQMWFWLETMKKIVGCIKIGYDGSLTKSELASVQLSDDPRFLMHMMDSKQHNQQNLLPIVSVTCNMADNNDHSSATKIGHYLAKMHDIPPQLSPPTYKPPPVPLLYTSQQQK